MKKVLCLFLAITCIIGLVGCSASKADVPKKPTASITNPTVDDNTLSKGEDTKKEDVTKPSNEATEPSDDATESPADETKPSKGEKEENKKQNDKTNPKKDKEDKEENDNTAETEPNDEVADEYQFNAKVLEISDGRLLVAPLYGSSELKSSDKMYVSTNGIKLPDNLSVNDYVRITYDGKMLESYPAQITTVYEIVKHANSFVEPIDPDLEIIQPMTYESHVVRAGWSNDMGLHAGAICNSNGYPVYLLKTADDIVKFRNALSHTLQFHGFDDVAKNWNDEFFAENAVILTYVKANSGSTKYSVKNVIFGAKAVNINIGVEAPDIGTCDMAGWFVMVVVPRVTVEGCTEFNIHISDSFLKGNF